MGLVLPPQGSVYVETTALIYRVERVEPYATLLDPVWEEFESGRRTLQVSSLSLLESTVKPFREKNTELVETYVRLLLNTKNMNCAPMTPELLLQAAEIRARDRLKTPDAIHAATALDASCALFVSNDPVFRRVAGLNVAILSDL